MCILFISRKKNSNWPLLIATNRDEFYERPTESMHWWNSSPKVLAGKDKNFDGTWMALSERGKFAAVTNVREFTSLSTQKKSLEDLASRGDLVKDFVLSNHSSSEYLNKINFLNYQGFNLILFDGNDGLICSNRGLEKKLTEGETYAVGNKPLENKSEKIKSAEKDFKKILSSEISGKNLFAMMQSPVNKPLEFSEAFTKENHGREFPYRFIATDIYGTRSTTSIIVDKNGVAVIEETSFNEDREIVESKKFHLKIK